MQTTTFLGEFLGTLVLILLGNGVVANVLLKESKGYNSGWMVITTGWAFAVTIGIFVAQKFGSQGAHLNPAVTIAFALIENDWSNALPFIAAQLAGAFSGAVLVWLAYYSHWSVTSNATDKLGIFCTIPAIKHPFGNVLSEIIGTFVLIVGVASIYATEDSGLKPFLVGVLVWSIGLSLGGPTGYAISPSRDLGPRLAHQFLPIPGKGDSQWAYAWVPIVGPIIGASIASLFFI